MTTTTSIDTRKGKWETEEKRGGTTDERNPGLRARGKSPRIYPCNQDRRLERTLQVSTQSKTPLTDTRCRGGTRHTRRRLRCLRWRIQTLHQTHVTRGLITKRPARTPARLTRIRKTEEEEASVLEGACRTPRQRKNLSYDDKESPNRLVLFFFFRIHRRAGRRAGRRRSRGRRQKTRESREGAVGKRTA